MLSNLTYQNLESFQWTSDHQLEDIILKKIKNTEELIMHAE